MAERWFFVGDKRDAKGRPHVVTVIPPGDDQFAVIVDVRHDRDGPYAVSVTFRKNRRAGHEEGRASLSGRRIQRLPLTRCITAALAYASETTPAKAVQAAAKLNPPRRTRQGTKPPPKWLKKRYEMHAKAGRSPAKEIAAERGVPVNRVHQWFHQERQAGRLPPSPRSRQ